MSILGLITGLLKLASIFAQWAHDNQLLKAGQAEAIAEGATDVIRSVGLANRATEAAKAPPGTPDAEWAARLQGRFTRD